MTFAEMGPLQALELLPADVAVMGSRVPGAVRALARAADLELTVAAPRCAPSPVPPRAAANL